jgi:hypothetical protein
VGLFDANVHDDVVRANYIVGTRCFSSFGQLSTTLNFSVAVCSSRTATRVACSATPRSPDRHRRDSPLSVASDHRQPPCLQIEAS